MHQRYALNGLLAPGRLDEALAEMETAVELDPLSPLHMANLLWVRFIRREYDRASELESRLLKLNPNFLPTHLFRTELYLAQNRYQEALAACEKSGALGRFLLVGIYEGRGRHQDAAEILEDSLEAQ